MTDRQPCGYCAPFGIVRANCEMCRGTGEMLTEDERAAYGLPEVESRNPKDIIGSHKPPIALVPPVAIVLEAMVLRHGANKYGAFNWRQKSIGVMEYLNATARHLLAFEDGEDNDQESKLPHLAHARATLGILIDAISREHVIDDRPLAGKAADYIREYTIDNERDFPCV